MDKEAHPNTWCQVRQLAESGQRPPTGGALWSWSGGACLWCWGAGWIMVPAAAARTGSLVLLLARPPAVVSAALPPFALAIAYAAQRLPTGGATVARLAVADLGGRFIATRSVAAARRQKNSCCVTTRRRNFRILWCLRRRYGTLPARALGLGVLDFGGIVLTSSGLPPRRLPASDQAQAFGVLAVTLVGAPWLVLASTALAQDRAAAVVVGSGGLAYDEDGPRERILPRDSPGGTRYRSPRALIPTRTTSLYFRA